MVVVAEVVMVNPDTLLHMVVEVLFVSFGVPIELSRITTLMIYNYA